MSHAGSMPPPDVPPLSIAPAPLTLSAVDAEGLAESAGAVAAEQRGATAWQGGWAASPQAPTDSFAPNWSQEGFANHTVRQVVRVSIGGTEVRIELSNRYGSTPLRITGATVARTDKGALVQAGSVRRLSFGKGRSVTIPAGGEAVSDAVPIRVEALESLTVTLYLAGPTGPATFHQFATATSYRAQGDHRSDRDGTAFRETSGSWYYLSGVEVTGSEAAPRRNGVVAFGDSLTDGVGASLDADNRYPDKLAERFAAAGKPRSVLNHGIGGNQVTNDSSWGGEKGVVRFEKDVLSAPGVGTVIVLEGINDIGASMPGLPVDPTPEVTAAQLIAGHRSLIRLAHAKGIKVVGATLMPIQGSAYGSEVNEAKRDAVNHWIRTSGEYDAVVDLDRVVADPAHPRRLLPAYDSGDGLHLSDAGYHAVAEAFDLDAL